MTVFDEINQERQRQIDKGYDGDHDDQHNDGSLLHAAILAACEVAGLQIAGVDPVGVDGPWPDHFVMHARDKYAECPERLLIISAALIVAEIERMQRVKEKPSDRLSNSYPEMAMDDEDDDEWDDPDTRCMTCGGDGMVDSVVEETLRYGWDEDAPGVCPNCRGSGKRADQTYW